MMIVITLYMIHLFMSAPVSFLPNAAAGRLTSLIISETHSVVIAIFIVSRNVLCKHDEYLRLLPPLCFSP